LFLDQEKRDGTRVVDMAKPLQEVFDLSTTGTLEILLAWYKKGLN
jgi:hypothetical protein